MRCEKCLYRKNCQFLATHKKTVVEDCSCFEEENKIKAEAVKEFAERLKKRLDRKHTVYGREYVLRHLRELAKEMGVE